MLALSVLRFLWSICPILGCQGKCAVKQSMKVPVAFTFKNSPFCDRCNHVPFGFLHYIPIAVYSFSLRRNLFCFGISLCNFRGNDMQKNLACFHISVNTS